MTSKNKFRELSEDVQVELVNEELKRAKGTKNFGKTEDGEKILDFSYGFARTILTANGYETLDDIVVDGTKVKLFRKMTEEEMKTKEEKIIKKEEVIQEKELDTKSLHLIVSDDIFQKNLNNNEEKKTKSRSLPIFEDTFEEFQELLKTDEFKLYERKYVVELMFRMFLEKYGKKE